MNASSLTTDPALSDTHLEALPIPFSEIPWLERELAETNFSEEERSLLRAFARDGYVILPHDIDTLKEQADRIREDLDPAFAKGNRIQDAWKEHETIRELAIAPKILHILKLLYRRTPIAFQTLNFLKGSEQRTHSDTLHFHSIPRKFLAAAWIPLEDVDERNGPLHVYPGSHVLPAFEPQDFGIQSGTDFYPLYEHAIGRYIESAGLKKRVITMKKGEVLLWAGNLLHGGEKIVDPARTRMSQVIHYYFENCLYYLPLSSDPFTGSVRLRRVTDIATGRVVPHIYGGKSFEPSAEQEFWMQPTVRGFLKTVVRRFLKNLRHNR